MRNLLCIVHDDRSSIRGFIYLRMTYDQDVRHKGLSVMQPRPLTPSIAIVLCGSLLGSAVSLYAVEPVAQLQAQFRADHPGSQIVFGASVAIDGETAVVGAPDDDIEASHYNSNEAAAAAAVPGGAYVYVRSASGWAQSAYLESPSPQLGTGFGTKVAVSGDWLLVSAPTEGLTEEGERSYNGAVYAFHRVGSEWQKAGRVGIEDGMRSGAFGEELALDGDTAVIGAPDESNGDFRNTGAVYIFALNNGKWTRQARLVGTSSYFLSRFGNAVAISQKTVVIGAPGFRSDGYAYIYRQKGTQWIEEAKLTSSAKSNRSRFGISVSACGEKILVGSTTEFEDVNFLGLVKRPPWRMQGAGITYLFAREKGKWMLKQRIAPPSGTSCADFGKALAMTNSALLIGALDVGSGPDGSPKRDGAAFVFRPAKSGWELATSIESITPEVTEDFGSVLAISGHGIIIGARGPWLPTNLDDFEAPRALTPGSAFAYEVPLWSTPAGTALASDCFSHAPLRLDKVTGMICQQLCYHNASSSTLNGLVIKVSGLASGVALLGGQTTSVYGESEVFYTQPIAAGQSIKFTLVYSDPRRRTLSGVQPTISADPLPAALPPSLPVNGSLVSLRTVRDSPQGPLLEWNTQPAARYVVEYSDDGSTWYSAVHLLQAQGTRLLWIDRGQPETESKPANMAARHYRVKLVEQP